MEFSTCGCGNSDTLTIFKERIRADTAYILSSTFNYILRNFRMLFLTHVRTCLRSVVVRRCGKLSCIYACIFVFNCVRF